MGPGARGAWAALLLGALGALQVLGAAGGGAALDGSSETKNSLQNSTANSSVEPVQNVSSNHTAESNSTVTAVTSNTTAATFKPTATSKTATPGVPVNTISTTLKSTTKATSVPQNVSQTSTSMTTTAHNSLVTSLTITATIHSKKNEGSKFDPGSFVGGIVLTLAVLAILYIGCKMYYSRRGIQYRTIDEHDAII